MLKKRYIAMFIGLGLGLVSQGDDLLTRQSGEFADVFTWSGGKVPGSRDVAVVQGHDVVLASSATVFQLQEYGGPLNPGSLTVKSGGVLNVVGPASRIGNEQKNTTSLVVEKGGKAKFSNSVVFGEGKGATTTFVVAGNVSIADYLLMANGAGSSVSVTVEEGASLQVLNQAVFDGADSAGKITLKKGSSFLVNYIDFRDSGSLEQRIIIDGGELTLTTPNEVGSLHFANADAVVEFNGGSLVFEGADSEGDFNALVRVFNHWVDVGSVTSSAFSNEELKSALSFDGSDAVLMLQSPSASE